MSSPATPLRLAQISDIHCGGSSFAPPVMEGLIERINRRALTREVFCLTDDFLSSNRVLPT